MIRYSVIIPHYESLDVLPRAINSVPERADIEVLIIDNSATPINSTLFSERKNVHILYSPYGKGAGTARNVGLQHAKGQWLLMLDADDFFTPNAFAAIDRYADSHADIVFFRMNSCDSDTLQPADRDIQFNGLINAYKDNKDENALRYDWSSPCAKMIRRRLVEEHDIRFDETQASNDVLFSAQTGYWAECIQASDETVYCATIRQGSLTTTPSLNNLKQRIEVCGRFNAFLKDHGIHANRKSIMFYVYIIARLYGFGEAVKALCQSVRMGNNPFVGITRWASTARKKK